MREMRSLMYAMPTQLWALMAIQERMFEDNDESRGRWKPPTLEELDGFFMAWPHCKIYYDKQSKELYR